MWNIAAMQEYVHENPDTFKRLLRALVEAEKFIRENRKESYRIMADYFKTDKAELEKICGIINYDVILDQSILIALEDQTRWMIREGLAGKRKIPNYLNYIYLDVLEEVIPEAVRIIH